MDLKKTTIQKKKFSFTPSLIVKHVGNIFKAKFAPDKEMMAPISAGFYITQRCIFKCPYCDVRKEHGPNELDTVKTIEVLRKLRKSVPSITISGGEPLMRKDIVEILQAAQKLRFNPINLFSNLYLLDQKPEVLDYIDLLSTSLDMTDKKYDLITGVPGSTKRIMENITKCAKLQKIRKFSLNVNCVVGPHNINNVKEVIEFVLKNKCALSISPLVNSDGSPHSALTGELQQQYQEIIDDVIALKKSGKPVLVTLRFLKTVRDFKPFRCHPFLTPRILPNGDLLYPCEHLRTSNTSLVKAESFNAAAQTLREQSKSLCKKSCYLGCYMEPSLVVEHPFDIIKEWYYYKKSGIL